MFHVQRTVPVRWMTVGVLCVASFLQASAQTFDERYQNLRKELQPLFSQVDADLVDEITRGQADVEAALRNQQAVEKELEVIQKARGLVKHAKVYWIRSAEKKMARAAQDLEEATTEEAREAARQELQRWEQNRKEGQAALVERQAHLDAVKGEEPRLNQALARAKQQVQDARKKLAAVTAAPSIRSGLERRDLDGTLAAFVALHAATPRALEAYAAQSSEHRMRLERLFGNEALLIQMAVADGPGKNRYGRAMEIYEAIQSRSAEASSGVLQRLALAVSLEHAEPRKQRNAKAAVDAPTVVDPVARYEAYATAYRRGELDPAFEQHDVWSLRFVVNGEEPDEISAWGREMLWNYRPDHIRTEDDRWRYVMLVRTDVPYGSRDVKHDRDDLQFFQNILMNGGVCGRRAFMGRFLLRSFGVPTVARPSPGHGALARWTPEGWVVCLGPGWGKGWTHTRYGRDLNFLASAQARALGEDYLQVKRAHWIGDVMGERRSWGLRGQKHTPEFWNTIALYTQQRLIDEAKVQALEAAGEAFGEKDEVDLLPSHHGYRVSSGTILEGTGAFEIPAQAVVPEKGTSSKLQLMPSVLGGMQLLHARQGKAEPFSVEVTAPVARTYDLTALVVTPSWKQNLQIRVNDGTETALLRLPHTVGRWRKTEPVPLELQAGKNRITFEHQTDTAPKGFAIHSFRLTPR